jgi:hypothetical protein
MALGACRASPSMLLNKRAKGHVSPFTSATSAPRRKQTRKGSCLTLYLGHVSAPPKDPGTPPSETRNGQAAEIDPPCHDSNLHRQGLLPSSKSLGSIVGCHVFRSGAIRGGQTALCSGVDGLAVSSDMGHGLQMRLRVRSFSPPPRFRRHAGCGDPALHFRMHGLGEYSKPLAGARGHGNEPRR